MQSYTCLLVIAAVELILCYRLTILPVFGNGVGVQGRVDDADAPSNGPAFWAWWRLSD